LNYERALALEPQHPEANANLRLVRDEARALELRKSWWEGHFFSPGSAGTYCIVAAVAFWIAAFVVTDLFMSRRNSRLRLPLLLIAMTTFACAVFALYTVETGSKGRALAIVVGQEVQARLATAENSQSVLALPPGSEIKILNLRGDWIYASLPNDLRGWIPGNTAERVRL
jgi:hypothetical protein